MERLVIYDADKFDGTGLYEVASGSRRVIVGERHHPLSAATADETATIIVVLASSKVDKPTLVRLPALSLLVTLSNDTSHINLPECAARDITVCNLPAASGSSEAEYTMALILGLSRKLPKAIDGLRRGTGATPTNLTGSDLAGKTLTVIGTSHAGRKTAALARAFAMRVLIVDPLGNDPVPDHDYVGLHDGLAQADVLSLHAPLTSETRHLINKHSLAATKPGALLINTAHGKLVDTTALLHALHTGHLGGAGLDAIEDDHLLGGQVETTVQDDGSVEHTIEHQLAEHEALLKLPNVILTHRHAGNTREGQNRLGQGGAAVIDAFLKRTPINVV